MRDTGIFVVGIITGLLCLSVGYEAYSQTEAEYEPAYLTPFQPTLAPSGGDRLDDLAAEIASMKSELAKKTDKPANKGWSSPKIGGRFFMDYINAMNSDWDGWDTALGTHVATQNWFGFREARLCVTGTGYDYLDYKLELGFEKNASSCPSYKDIFLGIQHVPILEYVRVGHQYVEDGGSEICTGTTNYTFMELPASLGQQFMSRRLGVTSRHLFVDDRVRMFFGVYGATNISDSHYQKADNQGIVLNTRMTMAPVFCQDGRRLLLFGAYYNFTESASGRSLAFCKPGGWDVYDPTGLGSFFSNQYQKAGFEAALQAGRFCVQADMFLQHYADVNNNGGAVPYESIGNQTNYGGFITARWFLTRNDYRKYNLKSTSWDGVEISRPFKFGDVGGVNWPTGCGAWELAGMYGVYDAFVFSTSVPAAADAKMLNQQVGAALNWYWNPSVKWAVNYFHDMTKASYRGNRGSDFYPSGDYLGLSCRVAF